MKKIVFVYPSGQADEASHPRSTIKPQSYPPLGLASLAASVKAKGYEPIILDAEAFGWTPKVTARQILSHAPDFIGIHVHSFFLPNVFSLIREIRRHSVVKIVLGGPHITSRPEAVAALGADFGIRGDGEEAINRLMEYHEDIAALDNIAGLVYRGKEGWIHKAPAMIRNLDALPIPLRDILPNGRYYSPAHPGRITTMATTRGCPGQCNFCAVHHHLFAARSVDNVLEEMETIDRQGFQYVDIHDPTFTFQRKRVVEILEGMIEAKFSLSFGCETRADAVDADLLALMKRAGCNNVRFGIEAGNDRIRNEVIGKKIAKRDILKAFRASHRLKLPTAAFFILGHPTETINEMKESLRLAKLIKPTYADFNIPVPIPATRLFNEAVRQGRLRPTIWEDVIHGAPLPFYRPEGVAMQEILRLRKRAYRSQYLNICAIVKQALTVKSPKDFLTKVKAGMEILFTTRKKKPTLW